MELITYKKMEGLFGDLIDQGCVEHDTLNIVKERVENYILAKGHVTYKTRRDSAYHELVRGDDAKYKVFTIYEEIKEEKPEKKRCFLTHDKVNDLLKDVYQGFGQMAKYCLMCGEKL